MHYGLHDFSRDPENLRTIVPLDSSVSPNKIGQRDRLSELDLTRINKLYQCEINECDWPITAQGVRIVEGSKNQIGDTIQFECENLDDELFGTESRTCLFTGQWSGDDTTVCLSSKPVLYCDFETDDCDFMLNKRNSKFRFARAKGKSSSPDTGPNNDLTLGTSEGYYYLGNTKNRVQSPAKQFYSEIETPFFDIHDSVEYVCGSIGIYAYGIGIKELKVNYLNSFSEAVNLITISGNQGPKWFTKAFAFEKGTKSAAIQISSLVNAGQWREGNVAIDDLILFNCNQEQYKQFVK